MVTTALHISEFSFSSGLYLSTSRSPCCLLFCWALIGNPFCCQIILFSKEFLKSTSWPKKQLWWHSGRVMREHPGDRKPFTTVLNDTLLCMSKAEGTTQITFISQLLCFSSCQVKWHHWTEFQSSHLAYFSLAVIQMWGHLFYFPQMVFCLPETLLFMETYVFTDNKNLYMCWGIFIYLQQAGGFHLLTPIGPLSVCSNSSGSLRKMRPGSGREK